MPYKNAIKRRSVREDDLAPHILAGGASVNIYGSTENDNYIYIELSGMIKAGDAIAVDEFGKGTKAGDLEAIGIAYSDGELGQRIRIERTIMQSDRYEFEAGQDVWLKKTTVEGDLNMSSEIAFVETGVNIQYIGKAIAVDTILINIADFGTVII